MFAKHLKKVLAKVCTEDSFGLCTMYFRINGMKYGWLYCADYRGFEEYIFYAYNKRIKRYSIDEFYRVLYVDKKLYKNHGCNKLLDACSAKYANMFDKYHIQL